MTAELVNTITGEVIETIPESEARRLTTEAQNEFRSSADHFGKAWSLIEQAVTGGGHVALGYRSPGDYLHAEFDGVLSGLDVAARRVAVRSMTEWGLSTRAIAPVVGVTQKTVVKDTQVIPEVSPEPGFVSARAALADSDLDEPVTGGTPHSRMTVPRPAVPSAATMLGDVRSNTDRTLGNDGKSYPKSKPKSERRKPLPTALDDAAYKLSKVVTTITNLSQDDRFGKHKGEALRFRNDLARSVDALHRVLDLFD